MVVAKAWHALPVRACGILPGMETAYFEPAQLTNCYQVIRLTHPHYPILRRLSYLLCQTLLISVYPLAGVKMKKCISVIYTDIHSIHGIRQKNVGLCPRNCLFLKNSRQGKKYGTAVFMTSVP